MITVKAQNFVQQIDDFVAKAKGRTREFAVEFIQDLNEAVVESTPIVTGFLRASWYANLNGPPQATEGGGGVAVMNVAVSDLKLGDVFYAVNGASYAWYVEFGTAAHDIVPVNKKALHWVAGGFDFFSTHVKHPGTPPRAFVRGTLTRAREIGDAAAKRVAERK